MGEATLWERVDEKVLRWVSTLPPSVLTEPIRLELQEPQPFEPVGGLTSMDVHQSLKRLLSHGLIDGLASDAMANTVWSRLRVSARGLVALGEWPDLDRVATAASVHRLLRLLAEAAPDEEKESLVKAAGVVARTSDEIIRGTAADIALTVGREVAGGA